MMGFLTKKDSEIYRGFFKEMAYLRGIEVYYRYPLHVDTTIHAEMISDLSEPIKMNIIFDENPKVSTLNAIKWVSENPDDKPYIAQLPFDAPNIATECTITIPPFEEINTKARQFKITSVHTIIEFPDCWTCTLAPIFETDNPKEYYDESNYNYVNSVDEPTVDTPNNRKYQNYSYFNGDD